MAKKQTKIDEKHVKEALKQMVPQILGHLDLEGIVYVKLVRTGKQACFSMDATADVMREIHKLDLKDMSSLWRNPACEKDWD